jgi:hypothetical protein
MTSSKLHYFAKVSSLNTITLMVRVSTCEFWGDASIQSEEESFTLFIGYFG